MTRLAVNTPAARVLILGGGYCGQRFAAALAERGTSVLLTHRLGSTPGGIDQGPVGWLGFDAGQGLRPDPADLAGVTHVLTTIPPGADGADPVLTALVPLLRQLPLQWLGYLSTSGVYGDRGGAWVDETAMPSPSLSRSQARLACEQAWLSSGLPVQVFRLPAIYGPGRCPFQSLLSGSSRLIHKPGQVFSRVHVDDIVGALLHCLSLPANDRPDLLNLADDRPCPSSETLGFAAHLLGCKLPEFERFERIAPSLSPMARSFWSENRRTSNRRLCGELGYHLRYPSYREGFRASLAEERRQKLPPE